jgi:uncharacterized protein (DUF58 family)
VAEYGLTEGRSVGLASVGPEGLVWLSPRQGEAHRWEILAALAEVQPGETDMADLVRLASRRLGGETSLMAITPSTRLAQFEPLLAGEGSRRPARAGVVLLESENAAAGEIGRVSERLRRRGLLTWVIRQSELSDALKLRVPHAAAGEKSPSWKQLA